MKIKFYILMLISSLCFNTHALENFARRLPVFARIAMQAAYRNRERYRRTAYAAVPPAMPYFATALCEDKKKDIVCEKVCLVELLQKSKFFERAMQTINNDYKRDYKIQLIEIAILSSDPEEHNYIAFLDHTNEIYDNSNVETRTCNSEKYRLRVSMQAFGDTQITEQHWLAILNSLKPWDNIFAELLELNKQLT